MTDVGIETSAPEATEPPAISQPSMTPSEAGRFMSSLRRQKAAAQSDAKSEPNETVRPSAPPPRADALEADESPAQAEDAGEPQAPPSETQDADPAVQELPPIEPPRSWTKEDKELFTGLPRETQERLAERERSRETDFNRRQREAAEKLNGLSAKEQAVEQVRQHYENVILPQALAMLQRQQASEFADIKTMADVERLAVEDIVRFNQFQVHRMNLANTAAELQQAQQRQADAQQQEFAEFAKREGEKFLTLVPEMADPDKAKALQTAAVETLKTAGFEEGELAPAWQGKAHVPFRDARVQLIIHKAALWDQAQAKAKTVGNNAKPIPPVQRPGTQRAAGSDNAADIKRLETQLDSGKLTVRQQLEVAAKLRSMKAPYMPRKAN